MKFGLPIAPLVSASLIAHSIPPKRRCIATIKHAIGFRSRVDHFARLGRGGSHRLFHEHVRARIERLDRKFAVQIIRREDADGVGMLARQHFIEIRIDLRAVRVIRRKCPRNTLGFFCGAALYRDDLCVGDARQRRNMRALGNRTSACNRNPDHRAPFARFGRLAANE